MRAGVSNRMLDEEGEAANAKTTPRVFFKKKIKLKYGQIVSRAVQCR